eukprot:5220944-Pyramimonas_sp.AAC.1
MIKNLANANACGPTEFVKKWNQQSGQQHKFTAKRVTSLKLLFETAPPGALQSILAHVEDWWVFSNALPRHKCSNTRSCSSRSSSRSSSNSIRSKL